MQVKKLRSKVAVMKELYPLPATPTEYRQPQTQSLRKDVVIAARDNELTCPSPPPRQSRIAAQTNAQRLPKFTADKLNPAAIRGSYILAQ